jgi:bifunctional DNA-binding transcriptional regulator/antitoxin component of YhaV-PrlF toxin-antitoxin module
MATLTITAKGQLTLKQEFLRHMKVRPGQKVVVEKLPDGKLAIANAKKKGSIARFSGFLAKKGTPRYTIEQIKRFTEEAWAGKR